jgi:hypothetical protein
VASPDAGLNAGAYRRDMQPHLPIADALGPDPEPLGTERYERLMAAMDWQTDPRAAVLLPPRAQLPERQAVLAA